MLPALFNVSQPARSYNPLYRYNPPKQGCELGLPWKGKLQFPGGVLVHVELDPMAGVIAPMTAKPKQILIVEDEGALRHVLAFNLDKAGFNVKLARNQTEALPLAEREHFDLIVTDYCMPYGTGADFVGRLREIDAYADTPVVFWTAKADEVNMEHLDNGHTARMVPKSCSMARLLEVISECLAGVHSAS